MRAKAYTLLIGAVVIAASWLLFVFMIDGANVLKSAKFKLQQESVVRMQSVSGFLRRSAELSEHVELLAIYATPEFFAATKQGENNLPFSLEDSLIFIINEDTHIGSLSRDPTSAALRINGKETYLPAKAEVFSYSEHHKISILSFSKRDSDGLPVIYDDASFLELIAKKQDDSSFVSMRWDLPIIYPKELTRRKNVPLGTIFAITAGLLASVLIPCLMQMVIYYLSVLTGASVEVSSEKRLLRVALGFVGGFTILFSAVGALAGFAGETFQSSALWEAWTRPLAVGAGVVIVLLGIWTAIRARSPLVCRLPVARLSRIKEGGFIRSTLMGFSFALGCSTCFGGALIATLVFYVGSFGSPMEGAMILFFFSLGIGIPFLLAAAMFSKALPLISGTEKAAPALGLISSLVMIGFGVLLITDNFHLVSAWIHNLIDGWIFG